MRNLCWVGLCGLLLFQFVWGGGCSPPGGADGGPDGGGDGGEKSYKLGSFQVVVTPALLRVARLDGTVLVEGRPDTAPGKGKAPPGLVGWRQSEAKIRASFGMYVFEEDPPSWKNAATLKVQSAKGKRLELVAGEVKGVLEEVGPGVLQVTWTQPQEKNNRLVQSFACAKEDRFFGLGARVHGTEHRGEVIPAWVSEQGINKIRRKTPDEGFPLTGDIHDSYLPVPFVMSNRGFGLLLQNSRRSLFHLCSSEAPGQWSVEVWHHQLRYRLYDGPTLLGVLERLSAETGRPRLPPKWAFAPWIDALHGQQKVLEVAQKLRKEKIASSAIWTEDWIGFFEDFRGYHLTYRWNPDTKLYPDLKKLSGQLHDLGFRFLGYFNPFIEEGLDHWKEALNKGYAVQDKEGKTIIFSGVFFKKTTLPDLTNPQVVKWVKGFLKAALDLGFDGWMADYAEWLPLEAKMHDGRSGEEVHNLYPLLWQKLHREVLDKERPDGDYVFFVRSGWAGTGGLAPVVWGGDQQTEFGGGDGFHTVVPLGVNLGMSGIPIFTHDIAGYSSIGVDPTTKELFYRWAALGAFSPIMRTHHGAMASKNWLWHRDAETIAFFRDLTRLHVALFPYRYTLAQVAHDKGWPMMRHLALHYPQDPKVAAIRDQFLLGPSLLVAPVVQNNARERKVYLPAGTWYHFFNGKGYKGGKEYTIPAKLEEIPVFAPAGALIPLFGQHVDTLATSKDPSLVDLTKAEAGPLEIRVYTGKNGSFALYDQTQIELLHKQSPSSLPDFSVDGKPWKACSGSSTENCLQNKSKGKATLFVSSRSSLTLTAKKGSTPLLTLHVKNAPKARPWVLVLYW